MHHSLLAQLDAHRAVEMRGNVRARIETGRGSLDGLPDEEPPPTPESLAILRANQATLAAIAGEPYMRDPTLRARLGAVRVPALVIWGASDGVVSEEYGRAYAAAIPGASFELVAEAGHLPQLEQPAATFRLIDAFLAQGV